MKHRITLVLDAEMSDRHNAYKVDCDRADFADAVDHGDLGAGLTVYVEVNGTGDVVTGQLVSVESKVIG
jgi:hypothetical protein